MAQLIYLSLRRQPRLYALWLLSLCLAVTGLVIIDVYRQSLAVMIARQGKKILTADISLSARRELSAEERRVFREQLPSAAPLSEVTEMTAMVTHGGDSRLAFVRFIDDAYPLIGELGVNDGSDTTQPRKGDALGLTPAAWVAPDLLTLMNLKLGEPVKIGELEFIVKGVIKKDSSQTLRFGGLAPRIYVHARHLPASGLIRFGSTFGQSIFARAAGLNPRDGVRIQALFRDPGVEVLTPKDMERGALGVLGRVLDYLGLIGLVTLSLGWVGVYYLGRRWLTLERSTGALLKSLGVTARAWRHHLLAKLALILALGVSLGGVLSWWGAWAVFPFLQASLPAEFELVWSWTSTLLLLTIGPLAGVLLLYAPIRAVADEPPLSLLNAHSADLNVRWRGWLAFVALVIALFIALTFLQARSWQVTGIFIAALFTCTGLIVALTWTALRGLARGTTPSGWRWPLVRAQWLGRPGTVMLLVGLSALAGLLAQLVPHLERTIVGDIRPPEKLDRPALFLFDVQEEQRDPLTQKLAAAGVKVSQASPFIRSRLLTVNGQEFERRQIGTWSTREEENEARFRNRGVNLSYRPELSPSEKIYAGIAWEKMGPQDMSVEKDYAERIGVKLGDELRFDVQGVELRGKVVSLREVNWDSFEPNFFVQFRAGGLLEEAPKTWIMTLKRHPKVTAPEMQRLIAREFTNVSSINVEEALDNITDLVVKLSAGLKVASRLAMGLGAFVFMMVLLFQLSSSRADWVQLRVQGLTRRNILGLQLMTYGGLAMAGTLFGAFLAAAATWSLARFAFKTHAQFDVMSVSLILLASWSATLIGLTWISFLQARDGLNTIGRD